MIVRVKLDQDAKMPTKAYGNMAAGYDLYSTKDVTLNSDRVTPVKTGVRMEIPPGYVGLIWDKSGRAKLGIKVYGGVIDPDFRGEIEVLLGIVNKYEFGTMFHIPAGSKIAQILIQKVEDVTLECAEELSDTERGERGFGSSGT